MRQRILVAIDFIEAISYISMMKAVVYSKAALKTLHKIPNNTAKRIVGKIDAYAAAPESQANNVRALAGYDGIVRLRVGDWRVLMDNGQTTGARVIEVIKIAPRSKVYKN